MDGSISIFLCGGISFRPELDISVARSYRSRNLAPALKNCLSWKISDSFWLEDYGLRVFVLGTAWLWPNVSLYLY